MPVYNAKSHDELRWEDYKLTKQGGHGLSSAAVKSTSSSLSPFSSLPVSTNSWGTTSVSTTPIKPNPFGKSFHSVATATPTWNFPGPLTSPASASPSFSLAPLNYNPFTNQISSSSLSSPKLSAAFTWGLPPTSPSSLNAFWSTPIAGPLTSMVTAPANSVSSGLGSTTLNQPTTLFTTPSTQNYNGSIKTGTMGQITSTYQPSFAPTSLGTLAPKSHCSFEGSPSISSGNTWLNPVTTSHIDSSLSPTLNQNPSINPPFTSSSTFAPLTSGASSLSGFWPTSIGAMVTAPANSVSGSPTFNQPTTLFTPCVTSTHNCNGEITGVVSQISSIDQPSSVAAAAPFGILPPKPHLSFNGSQSTQSIQYGISSIPVKDKPAPVRYPLLTTRHLYKRSRLPVRKYDPKLNDGSKVIGNKRASSTMPRNYK